MSSSDPEGRQLLAAHQQRMARLAADRQRILLKAPEKALDEILEHPQATALVHSMAEEDLYFLMHEIGPEDSLELLSLASNRQWEYILDLEIWQKDRISTNALSHWMNLLSQADPARFHQWTVTNKPELLEFYLHEALDIMALDDQDDPSDLPDGFFTLDGIFYICIRDDFLNAIEDDETRDQRQHLIHQLLQRIADDDLLTYQATLLRCVNVMGSESEEDSFRFRNVRLAEKGFLPFEEAVGVYAPMRPESVRKRPGRSADTGPDAEFALPVPVHHSSLMTGQGLFGVALWKIDAKDLIDQLQVEFAALCNQIIAADQQPVRERQGLQHVVEKVCGYLSLGLHRMAGTQKPPEPDQCAQILNSSSLADIFRTGYGLAVELQQLARKWKAESWYASRQLALSFWGERLVGFIGGLLLARPRFFDNYETGRLYREFESMEDIQKARSALTEIMAFDHVLSCMEIETSDLPDRHFITHENLLLTLWAKQRLGLDFTPAPILVDTFRPFFSSLWESGAKEARIKDSVKSDFLAWLSETSGISDTTLSEQMGHPLENLFSRIEKEYGFVSPAGLDPRFVHLFLLKKS